MNTTSVTPGASLEPVEAAATGGHPSAFQARLRQLRLQWHVLVRNKLQRAAVVLIGLLVLVAILAPYIVPHPQAIEGAVDEMNTLAAPSWSHPFGTDELGRDLFSRVLYGTRISVTAALLTVGLSFSIGAIAGVVAAGVGGLVDDIIMRFVDIMLSFPTLILAIVIAAFWGGSLTTAIIALVISWWPYPARLIRGTAMSVKQRPYVRAAESIGTSRFKVIFRHILPASVGPLLVTASLDIGMVILALATMSFLGVGAQPPSCEWGLMITQSRDYFMQAPWYMAFPGLAITLTVLAFNLLGDGLGEVLNPKTRGRA